MSSATDPLEHDSFAREVDPLGSLARQPDQEDADTEPADSEDAEDRNRAAEELAQARIAAAPSTARITAGWRKGRNGARVQGGSRKMPPVVRRPGRRVGGGATPPGRGGSPTVSTGPGPGAARVVRTDVTVGEDPDGSGPSVTGS